MKKIILSTVAALALTGTAFAGNSSDSYPNDKEALLATQRGVAPYSVQADRAYGQTVYHQTVNTPAYGASRTYNDAIAAATQEIDRAFEVN